MKSPSSRIDQTAHNAQLLKDCQSFMTAIRHGSLSDTQKVFGKYKASYDSRQALIHFRDHLDGSTMVNLAIYSGNKDIVKYLVEECEANINEVCNKGYNALHKAAVLGHADIVKYLLSRPEVQPQSKCNSGLTPLHHAVSKNYLNVVKVFVEPGGSGNSLINLTDEDGDSPLHKAAKYGFLNIVKYLSELTATQCSMRNESGETILHNAATNGHIDVIRYVLEDMVDDTKKVLDFDIDDKDEYGWTPLHAAAYGGHLELVKYLVTRFKNVILPRRRQEAEAEAAAAESKASELSSRSSVAAPSSSNIQAVTQTGSRPTRNIPKPVVFTAEEKEKEEAMLLYKSVSETDRDGCTPLYHAAEQGNLYIVKYLVGLQRVATEIIDMVSEKLIVIAKRRSQIDFYDFAEIVPNALNYIREGNCSKLSMTIGNNPFIASSILDTTHVDVFGDEDKDWLAKLLPNPSTWSANVQQCYGMLQAIHTALSDVKEVTSIHIHVVGDGKAGKSVAVKWIMDMLSSQQQQQQAGSKSSTHTTGTAAPPIVHLPSSAVPTTTKAGDEELPPSMFKQESIIFMNDLQQDRTRGVETQSILVTDPRSGRTINYIVHDYGGQEEFLSNHANFLSAAHSMYVVVVPLVEVELEEDTNTVDSVAAQLDELLEEDSSPVTTAGSVTSKYRSRSHTDIVQRYVYWLRFIYSVVRKDSSSTAMNMMSAAASATGGPIRGNKGLGIGQGGGLVGGLGYHPTPHSPTKNHHPHHQTPSNNATGLHTVTSRASLIFGNKNGANNPWFSAAASGIGTGDEFESKFPGIPMITVINKFERSKQWTSTDVDTIQEMLSNQLHRLFTVHCPDEDSHQNQGKGGRSNGTSGAKQSNQHEHDHEGHGHSSGIGNDSKNCDYFVSHKPIIPLDNVRYGDIQTLVESLQSLIDSCFHYHQNYHQHNINHTNLSSLLTHVTDQLNIDTCRNTINVFLTETDWNTWLNRQIKSFPPFAKLPLVGIPGAGRNSGKEDDTSSGNGLTTTDTPVFTPHPAVATGLNTATARATSAAGGVRPNTSNTAGRPTTRGGTAGTASQVGSSSHPLSARGDSSFGHHSISTISLRNENVYNVIDILSKHCHESLLKLNRIMVLSPAINNYAVVTNPSALTSAILGDLLYWFVEHNNKTLQNQHLTKQSKLADDHGDKQQMIEQPDDYLQLSQQSILDKLKETDELKKKRFKKAKLLKQHANSVDGLINLGLGGTFGKAMSSLGASMTSPPSDRPRTAGGHGLVHQSSSMLHSLHRIVSATAGIQKYAKIDPESGEGDDINNKRDESGTMSSSGSGHYLNQKAASSEVDITSPQALTAMDYLNSLQGSTLTATSLSASQQFPLVELLNTMGMGIRLFDEKTKSYKSWLLGLALDRPKDHLILYDVDSSGSNHNGAHNTTGNTWPLHEVRRYYRLPDKRSCFVPGFFLKLFVFLCNMKGYDMVEGHGNAAKLVKFIDSHDILDSTVNAEVSLFGKATTSRNKRNSVSSNNRSTPKQDGRYKVTFILCQLLDKDQDGFMVAVGVTSLQSSQNSLAPAGMHKVGSVTAMPTSGRPPTGHRATIVHSSSTLNHTGLNSGQPATSSTSATTTATNTGRRNTHIPNTSSTPNVTTKTSSDANSKSGLSIDIQSLATANMFDEKIDREQAMQVAFQELNVFRTFLYEDCWNLEFQEFCLNIVGIDTSGNRSISSIRDDLLKDRKPLDELEPRIFGIAPHVNLGTNYTECERSRMNASELYFGKSLPAPAHVNTGADTGTGRLGSARAPAPLTSSNSHVNTSLSRIVSVDNNSDHHQNHHHTEAPASFQHQHSTLQTFSAISKTMSQPALTTNHNHDKFAIPVNAPPTPLGVSTSSHAVGGHGVSIDKKEGGRQSRLPYRQRRQSLSGKHGGPSSGVAPTPGTTVGSTSDDHGNSNILSDAYREVIMKIPITLSISDIYQRYSLDAYRKHSPYTSAIASTTVVTAGGGSSNTSPLRSSLIVSNQQPSAVSSQSSPQQGNPSPQIHQHDHASTNNKDIFLFVAGSALCRNPKDIVDRIKQKATANECKNRELLYRSLKIFYARKDQREAGNVGTITLAEFDKWIKQIVDHAKEDPVLTINSAPPTE